MPRAGTPEGRVALKVIDWAYESPEAEAIDPESVARFRELVEAGAADRELYDAALLIWKKGHEALRDQEQMGLF
jgi:hypothetical protein